VTPCNFQVGIDGNTDAHDEDAADLRNVIRWMMELDEENVEFPRQLGSRVHRIRTRHGARLTDPREIVEQQWMGRTRLQRYAGAERRRCRASSKLGRNARTDMKATSKGNKAQGG
jgi:hypothetical protein